ncbi:O-antigen ligase family protein [uncultured Bacteroides sp.]|uniref:O-antigen ligase family protein n=1 Tax=uncultured Bacteroides sp. TaxID=162156 RepID=UPI0035A5BEB3
MTIYMGILMLSHPYTSFYLLFAANYILLIISRLIDIKLGASTLIFSLLILIAVITRSVYEKIQWGKTYKAVYVLWGIWTLYCIAEIFNPNNIQEAWNIYSTMYIVYPFICFILVPLSIKSIQKIHILLIIWVIFILIMGIKGYWQKNHGFTSSELYWLYVEGGARTHLIWSGIRFFSFFTDAANFGVNMGMALVTFSISLIYIKNNILKILLLSGIIAAAYGLGISGTRTAIAVPLAGLGFYIILSGSKKAAISGVLSLTIFVGFFIFTTIGDSNQYIRKMRSAFRPTEDASYLVRVENRKKIAEYMVDKPFGYGIGLGGQGERFNPQKLMPIPPDSWLVNVWTDTGIIGVTLYCIIHVILFAWCSWILKYRIRNKQLRGLLTAWLCMNAGFFVATYGNDVMQYPNAIIVYTGFALCFAGVHIDKKLTEEEENKKNIPIL